MENRKDNLSKASNASNFFYDILHIHYYADDEDDEAEFDMDMFNEFCGHIRNTYQIFYDGTDNRNEIISFLAPYSNLIEIAHFSDVIDMEHEIIKLLALLTIGAIDDIRWADSNRNQFHPLGVSKTIWYDFNNDTEETLWKRLKDFIQTNDEFCSADEAYEKCLLCRDIKIIK